MRQRRSNHSFHRQGNTPQKNLQRSSVLDFFMKRDGQITALTLPGETWLFEKDLLSSRGGSYVYGCEKYRETWSRSLMNSPGEYCVQRTTIAGNKPCETAVNHRFSHFCCDVSHVAGDQSLMGEINSVWIDAFSPIGNWWYMEMLRNISRLSSRAVSLALSFSIGHDCIGLLRYLPGDPLSKRVALVEAVFRSAGRTFSPCSHVFHKTFNGESAGRIGTIMGVLR